MAALIFDETLDTTVISRKVDLIYWNLFLLNQDLNQTLIDIDPAILPFDPSNHLDPI